jgi:multiple sugar transport system substrate-binding protein
VALAACGTAGSGGTPASPGARLSATLHMGFRPDPADEELLRGDFFPKLYETQPNIKIDLDTITGTYEEKIVALFAGGTAPDMMWTNHTSFPNWATKGMLKSVTALAKRDAKRFKLDDFYPLGLESARFKGEVYGLPMLGGIYVVSFNTRLFKQAGVPLPSELAQQNKWTQEAFLDAALRTAKPSGTDVAVFGTNSSLGFSNCAPWLWGSGADFFNQDRTAMPVDTPAALAVFQFQADLAGKHHVAPKPGQKTVNGQNADFRQQTQAMVVGWSTESRNYLQTKELEWDAAPMPKGTVQSISMYGYNPLAPTTQSSQLDAAWEAIGFLTGPYVVKTWTERGRIMATRKSAGEQAKFVDDLPPGFRALARNGAQTSRPNPVTPAHLEIGKIASAEFDAVLKGEKNIRDAATNLKRLAEPLLRP